MSDAAEARERLRTAPWLDAPGLRAVFAALDADSGTTRVVGGAVRDTLLGRADETVEIDLATVLTPDEVTQRATAHGLSAIPTGIAFGTVTLAVDGSAFEVTTLRHDVETDGRHAVVRYGTDWAEDARRRDFTFNALYCGPDGTLFDPLDGLADCLEGRVRFIGDATTRIAEDRLRVFRFFRFSASHGRERFDPEGLAASSAASGALTPLSAERIGNEMSRILGLPKCATTLAVMAESGILDIDPDRRVALAHYETLAGAPGLAGRLVLLAGPDGLKQLQKRWRLANALIKRAETLGLAADLISGGNLAEAAYRYPDVVVAATDIAATRAGWPPYHADDIRNRLKTYSPPPFPVTGAVLLQHGFTAGPQLGALLGRLERAWIASDFSLTREDLLVLARQEQD